MRGLPLHIPGVISIWSSKDFIAIAVLPWLSSDVKYAGVRALWRGKPGEDDWACRESAVQVLRYAPSE